MRGLKSFVLPMFQGLVDSLRGAVVILTIDKEINERLKKSPTRTDPRRRSDNNHGSSPAKLPKNQRESQVLKRTFQCMVLNFSVCFLGIIFVNYMLLPIVMLFIKQFASLCSFSDNTGETMWSFVQPVVTVIIDVLWLLPMFLLSRIVNALWFQDIADSAYRYRQGRPMLLSSVSKLIADMLFSFAVQILFVAQAFIISMLPLSPIGEILQFIHLCLLYSLYAFEYKWFNMGWELHRRLEFIENNWPYFVGFGLPMTVATRMHPSIFVNGCVFAIFFPISIVSGNEAEPVTLDAEYPLRLFSPVVAVANTVTNRYIGASKRR
ncbi:etoposide-induced protein 2.4 homolog [Copidosoma floridanum]|uniref:etoposide-induced protein 2.4 homolog n=1 Tax=Copidosoma floridanum TaxID=29053 RepID=UPI0006C9CCA6|nr:etoposide-induced protein 2.4 homolog [Copidosoma floridanum]